MKKGFTLLEVTLFIALSGALIAGVIIGTSRSIASKRYNDSVDNFVDYLQGLYSDVNYVQSAGTGATKYAIYGKMIVLGDNGNKFDSYTIIGDADTSRSAGGTKPLNNLFKQNPSISITTGAAGSEVTNIVHKETYTPTWGAKNTVMFFDGSRAQKLTYSIILIFTDPQTGIKNTYVYHPDNFSLNINSLSGTELKELISNNMTGESEAADINKFKTEDLNFCLSSDDEWAAGYSSTSHKLIRIHAGATNASGVEIISDDEGSVLCAGS